MFIGALESAGGANGSTASTLVARDASHRSICVAADATMIRVRLRLATVRARVANDAGEDRIVRGIDVAVRTDRPVMWFFEPGMVESRSEPVRGHPSGVAGYAGGGVLRRNVVRHSTAECLRAQPCRLVASVAIRIRGRQRVVVVDVARGARRGYVRALQRPARRAVIEFAVRPEQRVVAGRALRGRETCRDVIRYNSAECLRADPDWLVAAVAVRIRRSESVVIPDVAVRAGYNFTGRLQLVRTRQRPARRAVVERRGSPRDRVVARRAVGSRKRRSRCRVRRIVRGLPGRQMASRIAAIRRCNRQRVVIVFVTIRAGHDFSGRRQLMRIRQRETRRRVIKSGGPRNRRVTCGAE